MRIYTKAGDLAFKTFTFPDGQPHFVLETYEVEFRSVTVEMAIRNPTELLQALLVSQVLRQHGYSEVNLDIRYLLGARMDRAIGTDQPFTLECIARLINGAGFTRVRILDVHSEVATKLIRNSSNILPHNVVRQVLTTLGPVSVAIPDKGATERVRTLCQDIAAPFQCLKKRDPSTGQLSSFDVGDYNPYAKPHRLQNQYEVLIVDDICDGGGTFTGLAKELRRVGATKVSLFVTHGIFSKGLPLEGIDKIFTTDSIEPCFPTSAELNSVVIPISMEKLT